MHIPITQPHHAKEILKENTSIMKEKMFEKIKIQLSVGNKKRNGGFTFQANAKARVRRLEMDKVWNSCLILKDYLQHC